MVKYLVIRFSSIGDIVLTSPVVRCLKEQVEDAEIHFLTKKAYLPLVASNPYIDKVHVLEDNLQNLIPALRLEGFDYIIDLHRSIRSHLVRYRLRLMTFMVDKINFRKMLMVRFKINRLPDKHIVDRYMETLKCFDVSNDGRGLDYFIARENEVSMEELPEAFRNGYIALVTGAMHGTKQMPAEKMADICNKLELPVILLGGKREEPVAAEVNGLTGEYVLNLTGKYGLNQSASLIRQSRVVITGDTGMMHIASAFKKKIISLWGHSIPEFGFYPYMPDPASKIFEINGLSCRPCTRTGKQKCPKGHFRCMNDIDNDSVVSYAREIYP